MKEEKELKENIENDIPLTKDETKEIDLNVLYDGSINNTVVIDPVSKDEVLFSSKKNSHTIIWAILAIIVLLGLYFITTKTNIGRTNANIEPVTKNIINNTTTEPKNNGNLICLYEKKSDTEEISAKLNVNYEDEKLLISKYDLSIISSEEQLSSDYENLAGSYENIFINNSNINGYNVNFEKNEKGFSFNVEMSYDKIDFSQINIDDENLLYVIPLKEDTYLSIKEIYESKGYLCTLQNNNE